MSLVVNNNLMAANVARNLNIHYGELSTSTQRLSSGLRINSAADDAAGLAIRELQRADITTLHQGARNANDAISLIQTADGALQTIDEQLIRMKELAEQAATGTYDSTQRLMIESEYQQLASEITRIANATDFNGIKMLDGSLSGEYNGTELKSTGELKIHFGTANDSAEDFYNINIGNTTASALGLGNDSHVESQLAKAPTNAGYEELRDESAQSIYDATYAERYDTHYNEIYANLISTANPAQPAIPLEEAAVQAAEQAALLADKEAAADAEMAKATLDQVFDYAYASTYSVDPRVTGAGGITVDDSTRAAAGQDALKIATDQMFTLTQKIAEDGNLTSLDAMLPMTAIAAGATAGIDVPGVDAFPVKTHSSAQAYIEQLGKEAYSAVYDEIYPDLYEDAITEAEAALGGALTEEQTVSIQSMIHEVAHAKATEWSTDLQTGIQAVYDASFNDAAAGYQIEYDANIAAGHPADIAQIMAENTVAATAWGVMETAVAGTTYGENTVTGAAKPLTDADLYINLTMTIPDSGNPPKQFTATVNEDAAGGAPLAGQGAIVYGAINTNMFTAGPPDTGYMSTDTGTRGFNGSEQGLIDTAASFSTGDLELTPGGTLSTQEAAGDALEAINEAIISKDKIRAHLGAIQNRLEETINNLNIQAENLQASESRISDVDVATEMTEFVRNQILTQSAVAMLSQANSLPQMAQQIIGG